MLGACSTSTTVWVNVVLALGACSASGSMWVLLSSAPSTDAKSVPRRDRRPDDRQHLRRDDDDYLFDTDFFYNSI